ncbi:hypothetical protein L2E82_44823 [Cichorium intybus]|uniref:Uncharacterized protein n=1 Tax=Cichorium intybus TaxID=13427 RepID=A0ACB8ZQW5_CICIN|nr:hypothetical protein L2E82_44823 [Cichorium intybus]
MPSCRDFDGESMLFLQRFFGARVQPVLSTGSLKLDLALGIGGLPKDLVKDVPVISKVILLYVYAHIGRSCEGRRCL